MKKYEVSIYEEPIVYEIKAKDGNTAEMVAVERYNGGNYSDIYDIKLKEVKDVKI